jgi:hypothetical protein
MFSNILHKVDVRIANLAHLAGAFKEANRCRVNKMGTVANGAAVNVFVAPWNGFVEELNISSNAVTSGSNKATVEVVNVTKSATIATFDTLVNLTELKSGAGIKVSFTPGVSVGAALTEFEQGDVLAVKITAGGSGAFSSSSVCDITFGFTPNDHNYAF